MYYTLNTFVEELQDGFNRLLSLRTPTPSQIFIGAITSLAAGVLALPAIAGAVSWGIEEGKKQGWW